MSCLNSIRCAVVCALLPTVAPQVFAQAASSTLPLTRIAQNEARITLDGVLDEAVWQRVPVIDAMKVIQPDTLADASLSTQTRIFYNARGMYVGVMNYQDPETLVARMSSRDAGVQRDGFIISVDPSGEGLYGYFLRINLGGTFSDGTILPERQINRQWDGPWNAVTKETDEGWVAEIYIPWSMMSLPASGDTRTIGIYTERMVASMAQTWSWPALPDTAGVYLSGFQKFELSGINPATQFTFYPYSSATFDDMKNETDYRVGADLYWRPTSNMQLSATLNPDFGTVESDDVVVNLTAFETYFEEKRTFFLEGQDIFNTSPRDSAGRGSPTTLLNTRRIGRQAIYDVPDDVDVIPTDLSRPSDLLGALKVTGQTGNLRYGTLLAAEDDSEIRGTAADGSRVRLEAEGRDFAIGRLLYEDTSIGGRRSIGWFGSALSHPERDAVVNGVDMHYFSADSRWEVDGQLVRSDVDKVSGNGAYFDMDYRPERGTQHTVTGTYLDDSVELNDVGFLQRNDFVQLDYRFNKTESNLPGLRTRSRSAQLINQWNTDGRPVRLGLFVFQNLSFLNNASLGTGLRYFPPRVDDRLSRGNGTYNIPERWSVDANWRSDRSRPVSVGGGIEFGEEDLGDSRITYNAGLTWQPNDRLAMNANLRYVDSDGWLVHQGSGRMTTFESEEWTPKLEMDYFITAKQQLRFSLQWTGIKAFEDQFYQVDPNHVRDLVNTGKVTTDSDNFTVSRMSFQARYRWELAPLSDLFFVYTRGGNLARSFSDDYMGLFEHAWSEQVVDNWVLKLRYRLGS
ncbi:MAG: hypothetical protein H7A05_05360 [Pseudomonadales bacterium]|nr:hypothetical protein [Pseudomonadales bacterium]MCP5330358.1 hypothetical protein [Pseudomonadales bacterium]MCP5344029.1 hypothetical protein [Pseudomonadales bacterium]